MDGIVHYDTCPVCNSNNISPLLTVKDHTVSGKEFVIWHCQQCTLRFTQDVPSEDSIGDYYKAEEYISHTDTSKGLVNKLYKKVRQYTLQQKAGLIISEAGIKEGRILDLGCGTGSFVDVMKKRGWKVSGIEQDSDARKMAKELYSLDILPSSDFKNLQYQSFDVITLWHVMEHIHDLHAYVEQLKTILKDNGKIFIAVPNYNSSDADAYKLYWAAYDIPRHLYHYTPKAMALLMQQHGLKIISMKPMWFDSYYISMLSSKYKNGKIKWPGAILNGIKSSLKTIHNKERSSSLIYVITKN
jgi:2-polyprenyl-3-methyl-5-hydroxy-6-metoxy-1,4-benzoquinol methylase